MKYILFTILSVGILACQEKNSSNPKDEMVLENKNTFDTTIQRSAAKVQTAELPAEDDCVFDTSYYKFTSEALRKYKNDIHFKWNNDGKQAMTVLSGGDTLFLSIGGCTHFNYSAELRSRTAFEDEAALIKKARWLAKTFFRNSFADQYVSFIDQKEYKLEREERDFRYYVITHDFGEDISNEIFNGFSFQSQAGGQRTRIEISAYVN